MLGNCDNMPLTQWPPQEVHDHSKVSSRMEKAEQQKQERGLKCPRCDSSNTKFCYYNNYSLSQPRHFCKACKRYWTRGGTLRNVPVGGASRKNKRLKHPNTPSSSSSNHHQITANNNNPSSDVNLPSLFHSFSSGAAALSNSYGFAANDALLSSYDSIFTGNLLLPASTTMMPSSLMMQQKLINGAHDGNNNDNNGGYYCQNQMEQHHVPNFSDPNSLYHWSNAFTSWNNDNNHHLAPSSVTSLI